MKLSDLIYRAEAALKLWGDLDCFMHMGVDDEYMHDIEDVVGEEYDNKIEAVVFTAYSTKPVLKVVE